MNDVWQYWTRRMGHVERVVEYHIAKAGHSSLLALLLLMLVPLSPLLCALIAVATYLVVGKAIHHFTSSWKDMVADALIGALAVPLIARSWILLAVWVVLYVVLVLWLRWAEP